MDFYLVFANLFKCLFPMPTIKISAAEYQGNICLNNFPGCSERMATWLNN